MKLMQIVHALIPYNSSKIKIKIKKTPVSHAVIGFTL